MTTAYTTLLGLALPVQGELQGTWGDEVNNYITNYLDAAVAGTQTISGSQTAVTLSKTTGSSLSQAGSGATGSSQYFVINCTGNPAGTLTITAPAASKAYLIINATSTTQDVKIVGAGPTTGVTLVSGERAIVSWNGSDFVKVANFGGVGSFTTISATTGNITTVNSTTVDTTNIEVTTLKAKDGTAAGSIADSTGVVTLASSVLTTADINGGTMDNVTIGGATPAAGNFTNLDATGTLAVDGNVTLGDASTDTVQVNGYMGVGVAPIAANLVTLSTPIATPTTSGSAQAGFVSQNTFSSAATTSGTQIYANIRTQAASFTMSNGYSVFIADAGKGSGSTITNQHGLYIADQTQGTNNYGITSLVSSGSNKWNIYASGTAANYFAGSVGVGTTTTTEGKVHVIVPNIGDKVLSLQRSGSARFDFTAGIAAVTGDALQINDSSANNYLTLRSGNVGIGTSSPSQKLVIADGNILLTSSSSTDQYVDISTSATNSYSYVKGAGKNASATTRGWRAGYSPVTDTLNIVAATGIDSTTGLRIDYSGNLGLGVTPGTWAASAKAIEFAYPTYGMAANGSAFASFNARESSSGNWVYKSTDEASLLELNPNGSFRFYTAPSGTAGNAITFTERASISATEFVVNNPGEDYDFRVESDTNTHALFVQGSDGNVGIGTSSPDSTLKVERADTAAYVSSSASLAWPISASSAAITVKNSDTTATTGAYFGLAAGAGSNSLAYIGAVASGTAYIPNIVIGQRTGVTAYTERLRIDSSGNVQTLTGANVVWAPAPASISTTATLTNANIQAQIINTTGTSYTVTMPLGTTLETLVSWVGTDLGYNFSVINTASGTITMAANTGVTTLGALTIATGTSAQFRIRRTAANTFILYRLS